MSYGLEFLDGQLPPELRAVLEGKVNPLSYTDNSAAPGSATANTFTGRAAIALGASAATITCSKCVAASVVIVTLEDADATLLRVKVVPGAGSFVVTGNTTATAACKFRWAIVA